MKRGTWVFVLIVFLVGFSFGQEQRKSDKGSLLSPEQSAVGSELIMGCAAAPLDVDKTESEVRGKAMQYPSNTSLEYRGVVMADLHNDDTADEIAADFGSAGLWIFDSGTWHQLTGRDPDNLISCALGPDSDKEILVDFGTLGLWKWDFSGYPGIWSQLSSVNPQGMFATDDDGDGRSEVHVAFGSLGVWRFDDPDWVQLSGINPYCGLRMDYKQYGHEEGVWCFPAFGVWNITHSSSTGEIFYAQLTGTENYNDDHASAKFSDPETAEELIMDFGSLGLWLCRQDGSAWIKASDMSADRVKEVKFVGGQEYELLAEDNAGGLYWGDWISTGMAWTLITNEDIGPGTAWCETYDGDGTDDGDEEVMIPWTAGGASIYDFYGGNTLTLFVDTSYFVKFMVRGDYYNRGHDSTLAFVFDSSSPLPGLWLCDMKVGGSSFVRLSALIPDGGY